MRSLKGKQDRAGRRLRRSGRRCCLMSVMDLTLDRGIRAVDKEDYVGNR